MKKTVILCLVLLAAGFVPDAQAQDPKAKTLLDKMSKYYKSLKTYRADIEYQITNTSDKSLSESVSGQIDPLRKAIAVADESEKPFELKDAEN